VSDQPDGHGDADPAAAERWLYGGVRVLDGKRVHAWIDPSGEELLYTFKRASSWAIGSYYTAAVSRQDATTRLHGSPTSTGEQADPELRRHLWAQDTTARTPAGPAGPGAQRGPPQRTG